MSRMITQDDHAFGRYRGTIARDSARLDARDSARLDARDSARLDARDSARLDAAPTTISLRQHHLRWPHPATLGSTGPSRLARARSTVSCACARSSRFCGAIRFRSRGVSHHRGIVAILAQLLRRSRRTNLRMISLRSRSRDLPPCVIPRRFVRTLVRPTGTARRPLLSLFFQARGPQEPQNR